MSRLKKACLIVIVLIAAIVLNLVFTQWGTMSPETALLSFRTGWDMGFGFEGADQVGIFTAPSLIETPWLSLALGVILPMLLLGLAMYILVRPGTPGK